MAYILIADDDDLVAEILSETLGMAGHPSGRVTSGHAAWESIHARRPDALLLDQDMPGMSGLALLAKLRASPLFFDLPVVMLSAMRGEAREAEARDRGAQDFIRKPFDPVDLPLRMERAIASRAAFQAIGAGAREIACDAEIVESALHWQQRLPSPRRF